MNALLQDFLSISVGTTLMYLVVGFAILALAFGIMADYNRNTAWQKASVNKRKIVA